MSQDETGGPGRECQDCGFHNPPGEEFCQACNSTLGRVDPGRVMEGASGRFKAIRAVVEQVQAGALPVEDFARYLERTSAELAVKARSIMETIEQCNYWQEGAEEVEAGLGGVQDFEQGLTELWEFTQDGDASHLEQGLVTMWAGNQRIMEAMRLNRESRQNLALEWEHLQGGLEALGGG